MTYPDALMTGALPKAYPVPDVKKPQNFDLTGLLGGINEAYMPYMIAMGQCNDPSKGGSLYVVMMGGAGSGKSCFAAQDLVIRCFTEENHSFLCLRKVKATVRSSCFKEVQHALYALGWHSFVQVNKTDMTIRFKTTGSEIQFAGLDDSEKLKSISRITSVWMEEATEFSESDLEQIRLRLRGLHKYPLRIVLTFNPVSPFHWLKRRFFDNVDAKASVLVTTYLDNRFLDDAYKEDLEGLKARDITLWRIYAKGQWAVLEGLVYKHWEISDFVPERWDQEYYGLDFGFNAPSALVKVGEFGESVYLEEKIYQSGLTTRDLANKMLAMQIPQYAPIYADAAEPDRIEEIRRMGFNVIPADKGPGSVVSGILSVKARKVYVRVSAENISKEVQTYKWAEDKNGIPLEAPVKFNDHMMDAIRYAIHTHTRGLHGRFGMLFKH